LEYLLVQVDSLCHPNEIGLDSRSHDDVLLLFQLLLTLLVLQAIVGEESIGQLDVDDFDSVADSRETNGTYLIY
jgi:hypothetical protein